MIRREQISTFAGSTPGLVDDGHERQPTIDAATEECMPETKHRWNKPIPPLERTKTAEQQQQQKMTTSKACFPLNKDNLSISSTNVDHFFNNFFTPVYIAPKKKVFVLFQLTWLQLLSCHLPASSSGYYLQILQENKKKASALRNRFYISPQQGEPALNTEWLQRTFIKLNQEPFYGICVDVLMMRLS